MQTRHAVKRSRLQAQVALVVEACVQERLQLHVMAVGEEVRASTKGDVEWGRWTGRAFCMTLSALQRGRGRVWAGACVDEWAERHARAMARMRQPWAVGVWGGRRLANFVRGLGGGHGRLMDGW